jgi:hypothetical protein
MTLKARIAKLEKASGQNMCASWRDFIEGKVEIDPKDWRAFLEQVTGETDLKIITHGERPEGEKITAKNSIVIFEHEQP